MKLENILLLAIAALLAWLAYGSIPRVSGGQPTPAAPYVIVVTAVPAPQLVPVVPAQSGTAALDLVIISPPATATPLPPSTGLLAIVARHGETAVQRCALAIAANELLDLECRTIQVELQAIGQGGQP